MISTPKTSPRLVLIAPAPVIRTGARVQLDVKFVEGMGAHCAQWPGPVCCIMRAGADSIPFAVEVAPDALDFDIRVLASGEEISAGALKGASVVMVSGDDAGNLQIPALARSQGAKTCLSLEYTLETRLRIAWLDRSRGLARRLYSLIWVLRQERRRRRAIAQCDAVQANGYPAFDACRKINPDTLLYLDSRMAGALFASAQEMTARADRLATGAPLRLVYSGRLETLKGAQDLVPLAKALRARGIAFTLDIFGSGQLEARMAAEIAAHRLQDWVRLRGAVDFATELVPFNRTEADLFVAPHRQGDPSCSYIEAMGCGLPVVGYSNEMWRRLQAESGAGWAVPLGRVAALADTIAAIDADRTRLAERAAAARSFAMRHDFATEFAKRMAHLRRLAGGEIG